MSLFRLDASIFPETSASRALGDIVEAQWSQASGSDAVVRRDLAATPVPATAWQDAVVGGATPDDQRTDAQREAIALASTLSNELIDADAVLMTMPLYNYGVSQHVKTWFDLAYTQPGTDLSGTALQGKPAVLVSVLGGNYSPGSPREGWDHATAWLQRVFVDVWGMDLQIIERPFTLVGVNPALDAFTDMAAELKTTAERNAQAAGTHLAEKSGARAA